MLARLVYGNAALPAGFGKVFVSERALQAEGERASMSLVFRKNENGRISSDFVVYAADAPILIVEAYAAQILRAT